MEIEEISSHLSAKRAHILLLLLALIFLAITSFRSPVWYDDAGHSLVARELANSGEWCYPYTDYTREGVQIRECETLSPFITMGPVLAYPASWLWGVVPGMYMLRIFIVLFTLLFLTCFHRLAAALTDEKRALWALLLVVGNIQLLVYGGQFLGEIPALFGFFVGVWGTIRILSGTLRVIDMVITVLGFGFAIFSKEYFLLPVGLGLFILWFLSMFSWNPRRWGRLSLAGGLLLLIWMLGNLAIWGGWQNWMSGLEARSSYGSEFLDLSLGPAFWYILKKPVIWLGTIALILRIRIRKAPRDRIMGVFFFGQIIFFLLSSGFDRFGFQLIFIPAIYLAEYLVFAWEWFGKRVKQKSLKRAILIVLALVISWQQTPLYLAGLVGDFGLGGQNPGNRTELALNEYLAGNQVNKVFTFDQQIIPFLQMGYQATPVIPSRAEDCRGLQLSGPNAAFVMGEYGMTTYAHCHGFLTEGVRPDTVLGTGRFSYQVFLLNSTN